jgi:hypothetical protein
VSFLCGTNIIYIYKSKFISLTGLEGPYWCKTLSLANCLGDSLTDGSEASLKRRPSLQQRGFTVFIELLLLAGMAPSETPCDQNDQFNQDNHDHIGGRSGELQACSKVRHATALSRDPVYSDKRHWKSKPSAAEVKIIIPTFIFHHLMIQRCTDWNNNCDRTNVYTYIQLLSRGLAGKRILWKICAYLRKIGLFQFSYDFWLSPERICGF